MPLIICETNSILTRSANCVITDSTDAGTFEKTDTRLLRGSKFGVQKNNPLEQISIKRIKAGTKPISRLPD